MTLRLLHMLALFWMMAGIGSTVVPVWRAWRTTPIEEKTLLLMQARGNQSLWLVPGTIATALTGFAWAAAEDWNPVTTGWLVALEALFALHVFLFLPLFALGLRRVELLARIARRDGRESPELREALADNVPLVFGTLIVATVPLMAWLPVFKPF
ncbi:MAG: DUF2269 family protein [Chloroflexi bacterium]|nr:DUF2269 family protein [Chloroflexota bacterium]